MNLFLDFCASESGQDLTEYGLLAALVSLASILALTSKSSRATSANAGCRPRPTQSGAGVCAISSKEWLVVRFRVPRRRGLRR
jgi:Flp pilus assembly pilin Flp